MSISTNTGWTIERARKSYGPHVTIVIEGDALDVLIDASNAWGVTLEQSKFAGFGTEANADKLGFQLANLFTALESLRPSEGGTTSADTVDEGEKQR